MCTPFTKLTFSGSVTVNGQTTTVSNRQLIPAGGKVCVRRDGDSVHITSTIPELATFSYNLQGRGDVLKGSFKFGALPCDHALTHRNFVTLWAGNVSVVVDGRGTFA